MAQVAPGFRGGRALTVPIGTCMTLVHSPSDPQVSLKRAALCERGPRARSPHATGCISEEKAATTALGSGAATGRGVWVGQKRVAAGGCPIHL